MTIVGSPTIARTRILVPAARLRGRVEFHIGCFDLHTGELLWNAPLITGQCPLNMFGRMVKEYTAPPVRVVGDKVVVATELGTVACLDLFTGETLWQTLYSQIPIVPGSYALDGYLKSVWQHAPPVGNGLEQRGAARRGSLSSNVQEPNGALGAGSGKFSGLAETWGSCSCNRLARR